MPYTISYTDSVNKGTIIVSDSTLNTETSLSLPGRYTTAYGQAISENFLHLLENFASASSPDKPLTGQLYYDTGLAQVKVYNGTAFKAVNGAIISSTAPTVGAKGDMWYDDVNSQIYV